MKNQQEQLELFAQRHRELGVAVERFEESARAIGTPEVIAVVDEGTKQLRATVRRVVGILVRQSSLPWDAVWTLGYHELFRDTGYHAVVQSATHGDQKHLDAVQRDGKMPAFLQTLCRMLTLPQFGNKGGEAC